MGILKDVDAKLSRSENPAPYFCIGEDAVVTKACHQAIKRYGASPGSCLRNLQINKGGKKALKKLLPNLEKMEPGHLVAVLTTARVISIDMANGCSSAEFEHPEFLTVKVLRDANGASELIIRLMDFYWSDEISNALVIGFGLTQVEIEIIRELASGSSLNQISVARNRSLHTVRTQLKTAQKKIGVKSQNDIIRLLHGLVLP